MPSFGFIQAGYATRGLVADVQRWLNLYIEKTESGAGANHQTGYAAYCTPGKQLFCALSDQPVSCVVPSNSFFYAPDVDLFFVMSGSTLYAIRATYAAGLWTGTSTVIGTGFSPVAIIGTGGQLFPTQIIVIQPTLLFVVCGGEAHVAAYGKPLVTSAMNFGGTGYAAGDTGFILPNGGGGIPAQYTVTGVSGTGAVTGYTVGYSGTGFIVGNDVGTRTGGSQPGGGLGFTVDVSAVGSAAWLVQQQTITEDLTAPGYYINTATWMDGYTIVSVAPNATDPLRRQFFISALGDPTNWSPLEFDTKEANSDPVVAVFAAAEILGVFGSQQTELWQDSGNILSAFQRIPGGAVMEYGLAQPMAICKFAGTVAYLSTDARGQYTARMLTSGVPQRISNHSIENQWSQYDTAGASMFSYTENGHEFLVFNFPIPDRTWVYDNSIGPALGWHERAYWDGANFHADLGRYHGFFPEIGHVVGDYRNGNLYLQGLQFLTDNCENIRRIRVAPHITMEKRRNVYDRVKMHMLTGRVIDGQDPICSLRVSKDGGQTWGPYLDRHMGKIGEYTKVVEWFHLGYSRDFVVEWSCAEPIDIVLVDAYVDFRQGFN